MATRSRRNSGRTASIRGSKTKPAVEDSDEDGSEEEDSPLSTRGGRAAPASRSRNSGRGRRTEEEEDDEDASHRPSYAQNDLDDSEAGDDDDEDEDHGHGARGRKLTGLAHPALPYSTGSYLPTAYGGAPGGPEMALMGGQASKRERSVDRIRARSRDSRRDISKERRVRDRSRSVSQSRNQTENQKAADRAAERRRSRRASLEMSLGVMSMDDSGDQGSVFSTASNQQSAMSLISGMDSSISQNLDSGAAANRRSQRPGSAKSISSSLRDSTSTDSASDRRRQVYKSGRPSKTWDGRLEHVLSRQRTADGGDGGGSASQSGSHARSLSPSAGTGKEKRGGRRTNASAR
jgi:hypothetical protein